MNEMTARALSWTESGMIPDRIIRQGIRRLLERKRREIGAGDPEVAAATTTAFIAMMDAAPIALVPQAANEQHYELPPEFFAQVLGRHRKYSCCYWGPDVGNLDEAEESALSLTARRAGIEDGMHILDLGCGWGALSLWIAAHYPAAQVVAVSNSRAQRDTILERAGKQGLTNVTVHVCDMNEFSIDQRFDRIVSVEMFEHMRNYRELFRRVATWLEPDGRFFLHIFTHHSTPYEYLDQGPGDWMTRHFFSGGIMPSTSLPLHFQGDLNVERTWRWSGRHYARTCNAWLERMDGQRDSLLPVLESAYGSASAERWWMRWRMFFMACAELFAWNDGQEWFVSHYLFRKAGG